MDTKGDNEVGGTSVNLVSVIGMEVEVGYDEGDGEGGGLHLAL